MTRRDEDLARVRETYANYKRAGRTRLWDLSNPGFARMARDRTAAVVALMRASLPHDGDGYVLDLGCGGGELAAAAQAAGLPVRNWVGVDLNPELVASASAAFPNGTFVEASADRLPFPDGTFDVVFALTLFSSLPSLALEQDVAAEIARTLRVRGSLVWYDLRYDNPSNRAVHGIDRRHLSSLFPGWKVEARSMTLLPPVARRLGRLTSTLYRPLELIPPLRSHLIARVWRPGSAATNQ